MLSKTGESILASQREIVLNGLAVKAKGPAAQTHQLRARMWACILRPGREDGLSKVLRSFLRTHGKKLGVVVCL